MDLEIAGPELEGELSAFYKNFSQTGLVEIRVDRFGQYTAPYDIQGEQHLTYVLREKQQIEGTASFVIRDVLLENKIRTVAFGRDLRISSNRRAILEWGRHFLPVMGEVSQTFNAKYLFSVLSLSDVQTLNAFIRPRTLKRPFPHYHLYRRFYLTSLHGRVPWAKNPLPHLKIKHGSPANLDALIYYVVQKSRQRDLATSWDADSFLNKVNNWKNLDLSHFILAMDQQDNIVGCVAPWSSVGIQEIIPMDYSLRAHNFRQFLKFGKMFGWTRSLTKPVSRLKMESSFDFKYLNFLHADNTDIFESLIWAAYDQAEHNEFLVYTQMRSEYQYRRPLNWIGSRRPYGIYLVLPPDQEIPNFLHPTNERPVEMEPFFV